MRFPQNIEMPLEREGNDYDRKQYGGNGPKAAAVVALGSTCQIGKAMPKTVIGDDHSHH
jgi:hypothetical protein